MQEEDAELDLPVPQVERIHERIVEQAVNVPVPHVEFAVSSGEADTSSADVTAVAKPAGESRFPKHSASRASELSVGVAAVAKSAGEARPPGIAKYSVSTESDLAAWWHNQGRRDSSRKACW